MNQSLQKQSQNPSANQQTQLRTQNNTLQNAQPEPGHQDIPIFDHHQEQESSIKQQPPQLEEQQSKEKDLKNQDEQLNYYNEFCRLYLTNTILSAQLKQLSTEKNQLISKLTRIQKRAQQLSEGNSGQVDEKKKRIRRSASEIARHYKCQVEGCNKSYGSEGSLNQHLKIKHTELFRNMNNNYLSNNGTVKESQYEDDSM